MRKLLIGIIILFIAMSLYQSTGEMVEEKFNIQSINIETLYIHGKNFGNYIPHNPIIIEGNENFTGKNGVTGGKGTIEDPYIIEGWELNGTLNQTYDSGIHIKDTDMFFMIRNCYIHHFKVNGIYFHSLKNGQVENCIITDSNQFKYGIYLKNCSLVKIVDSYIISNTYGIDISSSNNITIHNNSLSAEILSSFTGIGHSCQYCIISNNTVGSVYNEGISLSGKNNVVTGNFVSGYGGLGSTGIQVTGKHNRVCYNNIKGSWSGVGIRSNSDSNFNNTIDNNSVMYNSLGMQLHGSYFYIANNVIRSNEKGFVLWISDNSTVEDNIVSYNNCPENQGYGIAISWCSEHNTIQNNEILDNLIGIYLSGSSKNIFSWNNITSKNNGFYIQNSQHIHKTENNEIHHNLIVGGDYGFYIQDETNNNLISYNEISETTNGVYLRDKSADNIFFRNNFLNSIDNYSFFELRLFYRNNIWMENYWGVSKILPKIIFGRTGIFMMKIPWINIDWRPALRPYDI